MTHENQTALICGTQTDLGVALAQRLTDRGITPVVLSPALDGTTAHPTPDDAGSPHYEVDLREPEVVEFVARQVRAQFGAPDISINLATLDDPRPFRETTPREARELMEMQYLAGYYLLWEFIEDLIESDAGEIITVISNTAIELEAPAPHAATHAALRGLTEALQHELPPSLTTRLVISAQTHPAHTDHAQPPNHTITRNTLVNRIVETLNTDTDRLFLPPELEETTR